MIARARRCFIGGMFTGLVEEMGHIASWADHGGAARRLTINARTVLEGAKLGDSISVNGCCLTIVDLHGSAVAFELLHETVARTSFAGLNAGDAVNLERALAAGQRMGGHFVTGHIDSTGEILAAGESGGDYQIQIRPPEEFMRYLAYKGSVAVDGVSLTVAAVGRDTFSLCLIPHTLAVTTLGCRKAGDMVNLEFDMLAKYVERIVSLAR